MRTLKMTRVFRLSKVLKFVNLGKNQKFTLRVYENFFKTLLLSVFVILVLHLGACIFIVIGRINQHESWLIEFHMVHQSNSSIYLKSFFYNLVVLTTVGYGDIVSRNTAERTFTLFWMIIGIAFYSYTISFLTQYFTQKFTIKTLLDK